MSKVKYLSCNSQYACSKGFSWTHFYCFYSICNSFWVNAINVRKELYLLTDARIWIKSSTHIHRKLDWKCARYTVLISQEVHCGIFSSKFFTQLCNSWNVNARVMFDIPQHSHCWIVKELKECHARHMVFPRYINFIRALANNKRASIRASFKTVSTSVQSVTGTNTRRILLESPSTTPTLPLLVNSVLCAVYVLNKD